MKIIISENQKDRILKDVVKKHGWDVASKLVGGGEYLVHNVFNDDPMEFLNLFNDLNAVRDENSNFIVFRYEPHKEFMVYDVPNRIIYIINSIIWNILSRKFNLYSTNIAELIKTWLDNNYGLDIRRIIKLIDS